jgi:hypothetical protein
MALHLDFFEIATKWVCGLHTQNPAMRLPGPGINLSMFKLRISDPGFFMSTLFLSTAGGCS